MNCMQLDYPFLRWQTNRYISETDFCLIDYVQLDYTTAENDPEGSVSIFKRQWKTGTFEPDCEVGFDWFNTAERTERLVSRGMRVGVKDFTTFSMVRKKPPSYTDSCRVKDTHACHVP